MADKPRPTHLPAHTPAAQFRKGDGIVTANPGFLPTELYVLIEPIHIDFQVGAFKDPDRAACQALQRCYDILVDTETGLGGRLNDQTLREFLPIKLLQVAVSLGWLPAWMAPAPAVTVAYGVDHPRPAGWEWLERILEPRILYYEHLARLSLFGQAAPPKPPKPQLVSLPLPSPSHSGRSELKEPGIMHVHGSVDPDLGQRKFDSERATAYREGLEPAPGSEGVVNMQDPSAESTASGDSEPRVSAEAELPAAVTTTDIGRRLEAAADAEGISHEEQAARMHISRTTYFEVKAGRGGKKSRRLAEAYLDSLEAKPTSNNPA